MLAARHTGKNLQAQDFKLPPTTQDRIPCYHVNSESVGQPHALKGIKASSHGMTFQEPTTEGTKAQGEAAEEEGSCGSRLCSGSLGSSSP